MSWANVYNGHPTSFQRSNVGSRGQTYTTDIQHHSNVRMLDVVGKRIQRTSNIIPTIECWMSWANVYNGHPTSFQRSNVGCRGQTYTTNIQHHSNVRMLDDVFDPVHKLHPTFFSFPTSSSIVQHGGQTHPTCWNPIMLNASFKIVGYVCLVLKMCYRLLIVGILNPFDPPPPPPPPCCVPEICLSLLLTGSMAKHFARRVESEQKKRRTKRRETSPQ